MYQRFISLSVGITISYLILFHFVFSPSQISVADVVFLAASDWVVTLDHPDALDTVPNLKALLERIKSHDKIAAYFKQRPVTPF